MSKFIKKRAFQTPVGDDQGKTSLRVSTGGWLITALRSGTQPGREKPRELGVFQLG
jgi:hypothetical protein